MGHYLDIKVLANIEFSLKVLMNTLCGKLHRILTQLSKGDIGISFPKYDKSALHLGERLRIHGSQAALQNLMATDWISGMVDHVYISKILAVPNYTKYCIVRRIQTKSNADRIRRRYMRRHNLSEEQVTQLIPNSIEKMLNLPYITYKSGSTNQIFRLFVNQEFVESNLRANDFNAYGFSQTSSLPFF